MRVGCIGLGHLGTAIARRLIAEGVTVSVWNRTPEKARGLGVPVAATPRELIGNVDIVTINLFDSDAVKTILEGPDGLLAGDCKGKIIIDTTTNHFSKVLDFHELVRKRNAAYLECTVIGSVVPASQGTLTVLVSGDEQIYNEARPLLDKIGSTIFYLGEPARATRMKLINNLVLGSFMAALAEAVALGEAAGLDRETVVAILQSGAGNSTVLTAKKTNLVKGEFPVQFSTALMYKDLHYLQDLCRAMKRPLFIGSTAKELYAIARVKGLESEDFSGVYRALSEW